MFRCKTPEGRKEYRLKHVEKIRKEHMVYYHQKRAEAIKLIGEKCVICGSTERLIFHEIHGLPHSSYIPKYYCEHSQNFITVCRTHHRAIHCINEYPQIANYKFIS